MGRRVALLDARSRAAFERGHAPGAAHLPAAEWAARASELPPRADDVHLVADDHAPLVAFLEERGHEVVRVVSPEEGETGPPRAVAWRPAPGLVRCAELLPRAGRALDVACGSGRDVAWLAARGLTTLGIDWLPDALARAELLLAGARNLAPEAPLLPRAGTSLVQADGRRLPVKNETLALVTGFRFLERDLFPRAFALLEPGGMLLWETFSVRAPAHLHPRRAAYRLAAGELRDLCANAGFRVREAWEQGPLDGVLAVKFRLGGRGESR